jgi:hypothetical protein
LVLPEDDTRALLLHDIALGIKIFEGEKIDQKPIYRAKSDSARALDELLAALESKLRNPKTPVDAVFPYWDFQRGGMRGNRQRRGIRDPGLSMHEFLQIVARMRWECQRMVLWNEPLKRRPGPERDRAKDWCARSALGIMVALTRLPPTSSAAGPYRTIAGLLYKALTGHEADLKRACDRTLHHEGKVRVYRRSNPATRTTR